MTKERAIVLGNRQLGRGRPPFIAAEMSGNHNQSLDRALKIVDAVAAAGAHGLKLQTYTADTMTMNVDRPDFYVRSDDTPWTGRHLFELYQEAHTPWEWHEAIFERARAKGIVPFSTPFDETAVDFLEELETPFYKIASFENNHLRLIKKVAKTGKPMIISTGMASLSELIEAVQAAHEGGCNELILLKCTSNYPATPANSNLMTLPHMRELFDCEVGLSDHTLGIGVAVASVALGACFIEKHVTLDREEGGVDADFSLEPGELKSLVEESGQAWQSIGTVSYGATEGEASSLAFRRSLYVSRELKAGQVIMEDDLRIIRPGYGLRPGLLPSLIGLRLVRDVHEGEAVTWEMFHQC